MRKLLSFLGFLALCLPSFAQSVATIAPSQCVWHSGDDLRWAAPQLDESNWQPYSNWKANTAQPHLWVRCKVDLSILRSVRQPAIQIELATAYQLYLDGTLLGADGNLSNGNAGVNSVRAYQVPSPLLTARQTSNANLLALRITNRPAVSNSGLLRALITAPLLLRAGDQPLLDALRSGAIVARASERLRGAIYFGIVGVMAVMLLGLFFYDTSRTEFLLLSMSCLSLTLLRLNEFAAASLAHYSVSFSIALSILGNIGLTLTQIPFFYSIARRRMPIAVTILLALIIASYCPGLIDAVWAANQPAWNAGLNSRLLRPFSLFAHMAISATPFFAFWPYRKIPPRMRPLAALCMLWGAVDIVWFAVESTELSPLGVPDLFTHWGLLLLSARGLATACVLASLLALLFRDQRLITEERALMAGEIQAARNVQQYLIPAHLPATPGFSISSEYRPAREVGGDFFQVLPNSSDNSLLIVMGDVAGKGIEAGMLATLIVGAVRTAVSFTADPARILSLLNERMCGRGLATCLVLRIEQNGNATLVNAGHLPPYFNGKELAIEGALPLGALSGLQFPVSHFTLEIGNSLMLLTDGVVEAQNANADLFGFERIAELLHSGSDGAALANAAQKFGQEDDITVLTITRPETPRAAPSEGHPAPFPTPA